MTVTATPSTAAGPAAASDTSGRRLRDSSRPIVIAHRGASAYRPEHTLAAYELAIDMGADHIEPDLVPTRDGHIVARHENDITATTDVASRPEFVSRRTTKVIDGVSRTGWFTEDFTLAELKTLRAIEPLPLLRPANTTFDGLHEVPTLQEVVDLARRRGVGIYPETKHPTYFASIGLALEEPLVRILRANGLDRRRARVFVQSFEVTNLRRLAGMTRVPLVQLIAGSGAPYDLVARESRRTYDSLLTRRGLRGIARYADGIGPDRSRILPRDEDGRQLEPTSLVRDAHRAGLLVHAYAFRPENAFLPTDLRLGDPSSPEHLRAHGDQPAEITRFLRLGVDGLFADNPDTAVAVRDRLGDRRRR